MTKPTVAANAAGLPERHIAIGNALQELEPDILDLDRLAHLVASCAQEAVPAPINGRVQLAEADCEAMIFGIFEMQRRIKAIAAGFSGAFDQAPDA